MTRPLMFLPFLVACGSSIEEPVRVETPACQTSADCDDGDACWVDPVGLTSRCVPACEEDRDCPGDQLCRTMFATNACVDPLPEPPPPPPALGGDDADGLPIVPAEVQCIGPVDGRVTIPFQLTPDTTSAMVVPFTTDGGPVRPVNLRIPDGRTLPISGDASFLGVSASLLGYTAPLFLPPCPASTAMT